MNILFISSKKNWGGVVSWTARLAIGLQKNHKTWVFSKEKSSFTRNAPEDINLIPVNIGMTGNPVLIAKTIAFCKKQKIDVIVTNIKKEVIVGGIAGRLLDIPVVRLIGNELNYDFAESNFKKYVTKDIVPCHHVKKLAMDKYKWVKDDKLEVIHIGVNSVKYTDEAVLAERIRWGVADDTIVIGITGRLAKGKGVDFLVRSFREIHMKHNNVVIVVTGAGDQRENLEKLVKDQDLEEKVIFAGFAPDPILSAAAYDIAVLASEYEAFPYTIVEYFSVGSAVITTDVGGATELVKHNENGLVVESGNIKDMSSAMSRLLEDKKLRDSFRKKSLEAIKNEFSEDIMINKFEAMLGRIK